jgi:hypothetical protein
MATSKRREKQVEAYLRKQARAHGGDAYKWVSPGRNGVPDRVLVVPCFEPCAQFVEVKAEGKEPSDAQLREHERIRAAGGVVSVVDSYEQVDLIFDFCCNNPEHAK